MTLPLVQLFADTGKIGGRDFRVDAVDDGAASDVAGYIVAYLLPFLVVSDLQIRDLVSYAVFIVVVGIVMTRGELLHINPWLFLSGRRIYTITLASGASFYLVAFRRPRRGDVVHAKVIRNRLLLSGEGVT